MAVGARRVRNGEEDRERRSGLEGKTWFFGEKMWCGGGAERNCGIERKAKAMGEWGFRVAGDSEDRGFVLRLSITV